MVAILEREQKPDKVLFSPGDNGVGVSGGIPVLTGKLSMRLCPLYLCEVGKGTFMRKLRDKSFDAEDLHLVVEFLRRHGVRPTKDNAFWLMLGAHRDLLFEDRLGPVERRACDGQTKS